VSLQKIRTFRDVTTIRARRVLARKFLMNVRRAFHTVCATAMTAGASLLLPALVSAQDNAAQVAQPGASYGSYAPQESSGRSWSTHWPFHHAGYRATNPTWRPLQPCDWGYGPYGPRNNLNSSQRSPAGMTWW
jgi:hypothetical protein